MDADRRVQNPMLCQNRGFFRCQIATGRELAASSALSVLGSRTGGAHLGLDVGRPKRGLLREVRAFMTQHFAVYKGVLQFGAATPT